MEHFKANNNKPELKIVTKFELERNTQTSQEQTYSKLNYESLKHNNF